jgi:predicted phosphodiesterase
MRRFFRFLFYKPMLWAAQKFSSRPDKERIFKAFTRLYQLTLSKPGKRGIVIPFEIQSGKFIIFSDQHKGRKNGADDFLEAEPNYLAALDHYCNDNFCFINLGDSEELWENTLWQVRKKNKLTFDAEKRFITQNNYVKVFGNHDLYWDTSPISSFDLKGIFGEAVRIYEGVLLPVSIGDKSLHIFCTHGHQGDASSDGNWFSKFFVGWIWAPLQAFIRINPNTPAYDATKKSLHNQIMYEWSSEQKDLILITGHTHQPVFGSLTHLERLYKKYQIAEYNKEEAVLAGLRDEIRKRENEVGAVSLNYMKMKPTYFNSGCCCYSDGDITGIEIEKGCIRLIKWTRRDESPVRVVLEEISLEQLIKDI